LFLRSLRLPPSIAVPVPLMALACGLVAGTTFVLLVSKTSPLLAVAVVVGLVAAGVIVLFPEIGYMLTVLVIPLERLGRFTEDSSAYTISVGRFVGLGALGALLLNALIRKWKLRFGSALALYAAYVLFGVLTVLFSDDRLGGMRTADRLSAYWSSCST